MTENYNQYKLMFHIKSLYKQTHLSFNKTAIEQRKTHKPNINTHLRWKYNTIDKFMKKKAYKTHDHADDFYYIAAHFTTQKPHSLRNTRVTHKWKS